ncbi:hypothetical protein ACH5RR_021839 [Cinchona calisaya]|uniref:Uncharacterized protein n=1 Tax=Cinchona calisaya TaxID=153742 RepID=A0ABD2Z9Z7_9GENT
MTNAGSANLVYVRRKPDSHLGRSPASSSDHQCAAGPDCSHPGKAIDQDESAHNKSLPSKDSRICSPQVSPIPKPPSLGFSSSRPTALPSLGNLDHLHSDPMLSSPTKSNTKHWEERSCKLNDLLKKLDQSDRLDYLEILRSLSSVELSKHAVELEKRSIQLSLEEAKELHRVQVLDVLERYSKRSRVPSTQQNV